MPNTNFSNALKCSPKKTISLVKTQHFLAEYPYILFLQSVPLPSKEVIKFKVHLKEISNLAFFSIKNTILQQILKESKILDPIKFTPLKNLKGFNIFVGGKDLSHLCQIYHKLLNPVSMKNFLILGVKVENTLYGPEDMNKFMANFPHLSRKSHSYIHEVKKDQKIIYTQLTRTLESAYRIDFFQALSKNKKDT